MPRTYIRKKPKREYSVDDLNKAIIDITNKKLTYRQAAEIYGVPVAVIYNRINGRKNSLQKIGQGRSFALPENVEVDICRYLIERSKIGYLCDKEDIKNLVGNYVKNFDFKTPFKNGIPGDDWYNNFMKRYPMLSVLKSEHLEKLRESASTQSSVIFNFYQKLQSIVTDSNLESNNKACFIFNAEESGFCLDYSGLTSTGKKFEAPNRVSDGSGRESATVLACVSADGFNLPPLIIFKGTEVQARWTSEKSYPGTLYGASHNGLMEEAKFFDWFQKGFIPHVSKIRQERKMSDQIALLLYDGHDSHISIRIVEHALQNNIQLLRFPSHLTDKLQPLEQTMFGPVKIAWDKILVDQGRKIMDIGGGRLTKNQFSQLLGDVWKKALSSKNIIAGFKSTGVFPVDPSRFRENKFDTEDLATYKHLLYKPLDIQNNSPSTSKSLVKPMQAMAAISAVPSKQLESQICPPVPSMDSVQECNQEVDVHFERILETHITSTNSSSEGSMSDVFGIQLKSESSEGSFSEPFKRQKIIK